MTSNQRDQRQLDVTRALLTEVGGLLDLKLSVKLWDGETIPLGTEAAGDVCLVIRHPGVISSLLRRPSLDRVIRHYIKGMIDFEGATLFDIGRELAFKRTRGAFKKIPKGLIFAFVRAFVFSPALSPDESRVFGAEGAEEHKAHATVRSKADDKAFVQFHYDVSNAFYQLFLDEEMAYTCAHFTDWGNSLDQAQRDKFDITCRKLRLKAGERFLDIGCGWGGLVCHAAQHYGVQAHGVTLSQEQYDFAVVKVKALGLEDRVTLELKDYTELTGPYDKIASIGMMEHIGLDNAPTYCATANRLLVDKGLFLNHAISRKAKKRKKKFSSRSEQRALQKYIFPGGELDDLGHCLQLMEQHGFEVMDVEGWREHYQLTTQYWCERLTANKEQAIAMVGEETYRIWVAYLGGVSLAFLRGSARLYQTLLSKNPKGPSHVPPSRGDIYQ